MFEYIERLRRKSDKEKRRIAFFTATLFSLVIFIVWMTVVLPNFKKSNNKIDNVASVSASPTEGFMDAVSNFIGQVKNGIEGLNFEIKSVSTSTQYYKADESMVRNEFSSSTEDVVVDPEYYASFDTNIGVE